MVDTNKYYYKFGEVEEEDIEGVINDSCNVGIDQIDTCTVNMLVENRTDWRRALKNQLFKKIRRSDSVVEFRGWITEVRLVSSDKYNLTLKIKSKIMVLNDLDSHVTSEWLISPDTGEGSEGTITARDSSTFTNSEDIDEPPSYTSEDTAVLIVPGSGPVFTGEESGENDVESVVFSGGATSEGTYDLLNDDDDSTGIRFSKSLTQELFMEIKGSSDNLKANVVGAKVEVIVNVKVRGAGNTTVKLEYWDGDSWEQVSSDWVVEPQILIPFTYAWESNIIIGSGEYISGNAFLDGSDDYRFRVILSTSSDYAIVCKTVSFKLLIFTDAKYNGAYFPITNYPSNPTKIVWTNVNPITAGIDVGDTMVIGWKDTITLAEIFAEYPQKDRPFTINIDSNFIGYTARSFYDMSLMDCIQYFLEKQQGHYYYDHNADTLYLRKESTMITDGTLRTITESNIENHSFDDKEETKVKEVIVTGATYKRGDGDEIHVDYSYPYDDFLGLGYRGTARKVLKISKPEIKSWTEARLYSKSMFQLMNTPELSLSIILADYNDLYIVGNKLDVTGGLEGITVDDEPIVSVSTSYDVGNDLAIKTIQVGWQRTPLLKRHSELINKIAAGLRDLQKYSRQITSQKGHKLLRADGVIPGSGIIISGGELTGITVFTAANNLNIGLHSFFANKFGLDDGSFQALLQLSGGLSGNVDILLHPSAYTIVGDSLEQTLTDKTLTLPIIGIIKPTADYSLTLPVATGNLPLHTTLSDISNIENTKLSTWAGSSNLLTVGALGAGSIGAGFTTIVADRIADLNASKITAGEFADLRISSSSVVQHQGDITGLGIIGSGTWQGDVVVSAYIGNLPTSKITTGTFADALIAVGNVTQWQTSLSIGATQLTGTIDTGRLSGSYTGITGLGTLTSLTTSGIITMQNGTNNAVITKTFNVEELTFGGAVLKTVEWQGTAVAASYVGNLPTSKITTGTFADALIAVGNVTQWQASLAVKGSLLSDAVAVGNIPSLPTSKITSGTFADGLIAISNVTQHQTSLSIAGSQLTGTIASARLTGSYTGITALGTLTSQLNISGVDIVVTSGDISCVTGSFSATSIYVGSQLLSEVSGVLRLTDTTPGITLKDSDSTGNATQHTISGIDSNNFQMWQIGLMGPSDQHLRLNVGQFGDIILSARSGGSAGQAMVNNICAISDNQHRIAMDPGADLMYFRPGDSIGDDYLIIKSTGSGATDFSAYPSTSNHGWWGEAGAYWNRMYTDTIYRKNESGFDALDDLAIIEVMDIQRDNQGNPIIDPITNTPFMDMSTYPVEIVDYELDKEGKHVFDEHGNQQFFVNTGAMSSLLRGSIKQLHQKVRDQMIIITNQSVKINDLETRLLLLEA